MSNTFDKAAQIAAKKDKLRMLRDLQQSDAWKQILLPHLVERAKHHHTQAVSRDLTPAQRAEHVEAVHLAEALMEFPDMRIRGLESDIRQITEGRK